jgi:hypothetical protein
LWIAAIRTWHYLATAAAINPRMVKPEGLDERNFITPDFRNQIATTFGEP